VVKNNLIVFGSFWILIAISLSQAPFRRALRARRVRDWLLDGTGLLIQGALIPFLQATLLVSVLGGFLPQYQNRWDLHPAWGFVLNVVAFDWLFYWNHRLLHAPVFWPLHKVHHTASELDLFVTSRNSLWTSFFIVYFWANGAMIFFLKDPSGLLLGAALTSALNLWSHSRLWSDRIPVLSRMLSFILITPKDHAVHHGRSSLGWNYGATFKLWDRIHGTLHPGSEWPETLGLDTMHLTGMRALLYPLLEPRTASSSEREAVR
jgi:sterol desaturase/sphingolipid hydroxylase (fatty acid hydroxylase superfamily)